MTVEQKATKATKVGTKPAECLTETPLLQLDRSSIVFPSFPLRPSVQLHFQLMILETDNNALALTKSAKGEIVECPYCKMRVCVTDAVTCPSCSTSL